MSERSDGKRNLLAMKEIVRIVLDHFGKVTVGKCEVRAEEARTDGTNPGSPVGKYLRAEQDDPFLGKPRVSQYPRLVARSSIVVFGVVHRKVSGQHRLRAFIA